MADIIISEAEMTKAINQISAYVEFLAGCAKEYRSILTELSQCGIQDVAIKAALFDLQAEVNGFDGSVPESSLEAVEAFRSFLDELATADDFVYPYSMLDRISILLAQFLGG